MKVSKCSKCEAHVEWHNIDGKWRCYNEGTQTDHWDSCSKNRFEQIKKTGKYFEDGKQRGYYTNLNKSGVQLIQTSSGIIKAKEAIEGTCNNCVVPWEECPNDCPHNIVIKSKVKHENNSIH